MWQLEFKRLFYNKTTILIILLLLIGPILSFIETFLYKQELLSQLSNPAEDLTLENVKLAIENTNGMYFMNRFFSSTPLTIYITELYFIIGVFLSSTLNKLIESGQEYTIISRISYKTHIKNLLKAQSIYISLIVTISIGLALIIAFILGGFGNFTVGYGPSRIGLFSAVTIIIIKVITIFTTAIFINGIVSLSNVYIKKSLVLQSIPYVFFSGFLYLFISTLGNLAITLTWAITPILPAAQVQFIANYSENIPLHIIWSCFPFVVYGILFYTMYIINVKTFTKECI